jgi:hypothetical protein
MTEAAFDDDDDDWDMSKARAKLAQKQDKRRAPSKARKRVILESSDGRSLRATGRTAQFNFRSSPEIKEMATSAAEAAGVSLALWMEDAIKAALRKQGIAIDEGGEDA